MIRFVGEREYSNNAKFVRISNFDRITGTPTDFTVDLTNETRLNGAKNVWVDKVTLPHKFNNITANNNVIFLFAERAVPADNILINVTVPPGQYTVNQLMTVLKNLIDPLLVATFGVGSSITFTYNAITNRIEFTIVNFDTVQFLYTVGPPTALQYSTIAYNLGYTADMSPLASGAFPFGPSLGGPAMIFLHSQNINQQGTFLSINRPVSTFCSIPVTVNYLDTIVYQSIGSGIDYINLNGIRNVANLTIKLRAQDGTLLTLGDNDEIIIILKVDY